MDALQDDIQHLNERLFSLVSPESLGARALVLLDASPEVSQQIKAATPREIATAVRCRVPLVTLTANIESILHSDPANWPANGAVETPPQLQELTQFVLGLAHSVVRVDSVVAQLLFGLTRSGTERLRQLGITHMTTLSRWPAVLLRLRAGSEPLVWDRILIGKRCDGPRAYRISQEAALLSLGLGMK